MYKKTYSNYLLLNNKINKYRFESSLILLISVASKYLCRGSRYPLFSVVFFFLNAERQIVVIESSS